MNYKYYLLSLALIFSACGGESIGNNPYYTDYKPIGKQLSKTKLQNDLKSFSDKAMVVGMISSLYNKAYLQFLPKNAPSMYHNDYASYGFNQNWNQGFLGDGIIIGINDTGTNDLTKVVINNNYDYIKKTSTKWNSLENRLNNSNFIAYKNNNYLTNTSGLPLLHGKEVMNTASVVANNLSFANILNPINETEIGKKINLAATIDALSNKGIRFFNQSYAATSPMSSEKDAGVFYTAITKNNALVFNSAGNDKNDGIFTSHALAPNSPLKKGWVIVLGYRADVKSFDDLSTYYIQDNDGVIKPVYHHGATCTKYGWDDCISAPFYINGNKGTSYSSPLTASVAALIYEKYPWMSNDNIKESLFTTVFKVLDNLSRTDTDEIKSKFGVGIINPTKAMNGVSSFRHDFYANIDIDNLYVFSNNISGNYGLIKDGIGSLVLSGKNTFKGDSYIKGGTLWLSNSNQAHFNNEAGILRLSNASAKKITNNSIMINEGLVAWDLNLGEKSKIYSNLGEELRVLNKASLNGEFNLIGVKNGINIKQGQNVDILSAKIIENRFKSVQSLSAFLEISEPSYSANKVSVNVKRIDLDKINSLNDYASKNYEGLFNQLDNYLQYEINKQDKNTSDISAGYIAANTDGGLNEDDFIRANDFYADILNTSKDELENITNKLFANDIYNNALVDIASAKNFLNNDLKDEFKLSYNFDNINKLKSHHSTILLSTAGSENAFNFGLVLKSFNTNNDNFANDGIRAGFLAKYDYWLNDFDITNKFAYLYTHSKYDRFLNNAKITNHFLGYSLALKYNALISPYISFNSLYFNQGAFKEKGDEFALDYKSFNKFLNYAKAGFNVDIHDFSKGFIFDINAEYNFYKDFYLNAKNIKYQNDIKVGDKFNKKLVGNTRLEFYAKRFDRYLLGISYELDFAKDYINHKINLQGKYNLF